MHLNKFKFCNISHSLDVRTLNDIIIKQLTVHVDQWTIVLELHCEVFNFKSRSSSTLISKHPNLMDNVESIRGYGFELRMVDLIRGIN